jgi:adenine nucleotide transporter 17
MQSKVSAATESACGVGGTVFSTFCVFPIDLVKTRIIIDSSLANKGIFSSIVEMARKEGVASLWRGVDIELIKAIASNSIYSYVYAYLKNIIIATALKQQALPDKQTLSSSKSLASLMINPDTKVSLAKDGPAGTNYAPMPVKPQSLGVMANLIIGCIAGSVTQGFVNPLNVVCTRMQVQRGKSKSDGMIETFQKLYAEGGIEAMYRYELCSNPLCFRVESYFVFCFSSGFVPSLVLSLNPSIQYMVFDQLKLFWLRRKQNANVEGFKNTKDVGLSPLESLIIGGLAKAAATYATYRTFQNLVDKLETTRFMFKLSQR